MSAERSAEKDATWRPPAYGFGLLRSATDAPDPLVTGGLDDTVEVVEDSVIPPGVDARDE